MFVHCPHISNQMIDCFRVYDYPQCLRIRVGSKYDGGYIIVDGIGRYDLMLSGGAGRNTNFEYEFSQRYDVKAIIFDHTVSDLIQANELIELCPHKLDRHNNCGKIIQSHKDIFLKLDIEGCEFDIISSWSDDIIKNIKQYVIEYHFPYTIDRINSVWKMLKYHTIIHIHGNNCCGYHKIDYTYMPKVLEVTAVRNDIFDITNAFPYRTNLPLNIDYPNMHQRRELYINYPPLTNSVYST